jgi:hypothetical protein
MATIGKLAVQITADTAGLSSGLANAGRQTDDFQNRLGGLTNKLKILGPAAIAAGGAFAIGMVKSVANTADELAKLSARTGVAVEDLSRLQYAAGLSGVSNQTLTASIERLSRGMADAANGTGEAGKAFEAMGVSVKNQDGSLRSQRDVLQDVAERFSGYADGAEKSALAQQIFGRSGAQLIPLLNSGAKGLKDMADESDRLGNTISTSTAKAAEEFNDNITRLTTAMGGLARTIAGPVVEAMAKFTTSMLDAWKQGDTMFGMLERGFKRLTQANTIEGARKKVNELEEAMHSMMATPGFDPASMGFMNLQRNLDEARKVLHDLMSEQQKALTVQEDRPPPPRIDAVDEEARKKAEREAKDAADREQRLVEEMQRRLEILRQSALSEEAFTTEKHEAEMQLLQDGLDAKLIAEQDYMLLRQDLELKHMEELGNIRERAYQEDQRRTQQWAQFEIQQRQNVANAAVGLLSQLGSKSKAAAIAAIALGKALSIAQIIQNTAVAQMRALAELGPIAGPPAAAKIGSLGKIQAGIVAATGLAQAASVGGGGGSAGLSSGSSIQEAATNTGSVGGGSGGGSRGQIVTIQIQGETFGRESVRNLISEINEAISDGAVLRLA